MNYISINNSKKFSLISGDKNKIHTNKNFTKNLFLRDTVVHGINLVLLGLLKYFKYKKKIKIINIKINFKNYCLNGEEFSVKLKKNKIFIKNKVNNKVLIQLKYSSFRSRVNPLKTDVLTKKIANFYKIKNINNCFDLNLIKHLINISRYVGSIKPGPGSLIHSINTNKTSDFNNSKKFIKIKKIIRNIYSIKLLNNGYHSTIISSKLIPVKFKKEKFGLPRNIIKKLKSKKILFFGISGDISKSIILSLRKTQAKISGYSFKNYPTASINKNKNIEKILKNIKPHYIFYLSSPPIINDSKNNTVLFKAYEEVYCKKFKIILDLLYKNNLKSKIFYPSSVYLNSKKKYLRLKSYLRAKEKAEKICKNHIYSKFIKCFRLPQFKTRSNYNMLGFYEGTETYKIRKYLIKFF